MIRCHFCITNWVDRAIDAAGVELTSLARRRLIAGLLSHPHLILTGPPGTGKGQLARALALASVDGQEERVCRLQGHPWWAADTADVGRFVELQTDFSLWRLAQFADLALNDHAAISLPSVHVSHSSVAVPRRPHQDNVEGGGICHRVVCVERMSPVEIELYFKVVAQWLLQKHEGETGPLLIRLVGTYDDGVPPTLDQHVGRLVALVHLERAGARDVRRQRPGEGLRENSLVTSL